MKISKDLIEKYLKGNVTEIEKTKLLEWIEANDANKKEFMKYRWLYDKAIWSESQTFNESSKTNQTRTISWKLVREFAKIAAVIAIVATTTLVVQKQFQNQPVAYSQIVEAPKGQYVKLTLADGTKVTLNSNSKLTFPSAFENNKRVVELDGEGYFEVAHNKHKPFFVRTKSCDVKVLGTKFNVLAYRNSNIFETSLVEGSVEVLNIGSKQKQLLTPNQKVVLQNNNLFVEAMSNTNDLMWKDGIIVFDNLPLSKIFDKLSSYYAIKIVTHNTEVLHKTCTAKFRQNDGIDHIMLVLQKSYGFNLTRNDEMTELHIN